MNAGVWQQMNAGERIRARRRKLNLSQSELSRESGVDRALICKIEAGKRGIGLLTATRLAEVLGIQTESLYADKKPKKVAAQS